MTRKDLHGGLIILSMMFVFGSLGGVTIWLTGQEKPNSETLCLTEHPPKSHTIIVIDKTDRYDNQQESSLKKLILAEKARLRQFDKLTISLLTDDPDQPIEILFSLCNPGDKKEANMFYENPRRKAEFFQSRFEEPLDDMLDELTDIDPSSRSPLLEGFSSLVTLFVTSSSIEDRQLIIVSDMLHHDPEGYSQYLIHESFDAVVKAFGFDAFPDYLGTDIDVRLIQRPSMKRHQGDWLVDFWRSYFRLSGAGKFRMVPISQHLALDQN